MLAAIALMVKSRRLRSSKSSGARRRATSTSNGSPAMSRRTARATSRSSSRTKNAPSNALAMARARRIPSSGTTTSRSCVGRPSSRSRTKPPTNQAGSPRVQMKESTWSIMVMNGRLWRIAKEQTAACQTQYAVRNTPREMRSTPALAAYGAPGSRPALRAAGCAWPHGAPHRLRRRPQPPARAPERPSIPHMG